MSASVIHTGDCRAILPTLPAASVQCVVTSPPYWGLRDYGVEGQLGLEPTPEAYVDALVAVFRAVWRVLRDDGTLWLNLGDCYAGSWGAQSRPDGRPMPLLEGGDMLSARQIQAAPRGTHTGSCKRTPGLKPKDLIGLPWRVALALQADGWYLRRDIVWAKGLSFCPAYAGSVMPESVTDRPTTSHEYLFLLTKAARYFYDEEAVRESWADQRHGRAGGTRHERAERLRGPRRRPNAAPATFGRNLRSVWAINPKPYTDAHFATFPPDLVVPCIKAGTSARGSCAACGASWVRQVTTDHVRSPGHGAGSVVGRHYRTGQNNFDGAGMPRLSKRTTTTGWAPACATKFRGL